MLIPETIQDPIALREFWIKSKVNKESVTLFDYERPLKQFDTGHVSYFKNRVARYGFVSTCLSVLIP